VTKQSQIEFIKKGMRFNPLQLKRIYSISYDIKT